MSGGGGVQRGKSRRRRLARNQGEDARRRVGRHPPRAAFCVSTPVRMRQSKLKAAPADRCNWNPCARAADSLASTWRCSRYFAHALIHPQPRRFQTGRHTVCDYPSADAEFGDKRRDVLDGAGAFLEAAARSRIPPDVFRASFARARSAARMCADVDGFRFTSPRQRILLHGRTTWKTGSSVSCSHGYNQHVDRCRERLRA